MSIIVLITPKVIPLVVSVLVRHPNSIALGVKNGIATLVKMHDTARAATNPEISPLKRPGIRHVPAAQRDLPANSTALHQTAKITIGITTRMRRF